jgi:sarcosine oxidase subunit gamma
MVEALIAVDALDRIATPSGADSAATIVQPVSGWGLATVVARKGQGAALAARVAELYQVELSQGPKLAAGSGIAFMGSAPGAWLAAADAGHPTWALDLAEALKGVASVADQSDAYIAARVSGPEAEAMLAKSTTLDLHPSVFPVGSAAVTTAAHLGLILWRREAETFEMLAFRSYAATFWHWLTEAAHGFDARVKTGA